MRENAFLQGGFADDLSQDLWWFILLTNNITNPISVVQPGTVLKIIKKEYVDDIINNILKLNNA